MKQTVLQLTVLLLGVLVSVFIPTLVSGDVVGIDLGTQSFKIGLIRPGAFEIVLNEQSGRKTLSQVGWYNDERVFASDAYNMWARNPKQVYSMFTPLLGKPYDENKLEEIGLGVLGYQIKNDTERNTFSLVYDDESVYSPEEMTAMLFRRVKELVASGRKGVKECVISVPPFYNYHQRQAIIDAANLAGFTVLSLINDVNAASINFAMDRTFDKNQTAIFYDMGAKSTKLSLVNLSTISVPDGKRNKTITSNIVKSLDWDENLGGIDFDMVIVNHLKKELLKQYPTVNINDKKLTIKLLKEASKMKETLSANQQAHIFIGSIFDDNDFSSSITRKEFEELSANLFERAIAPLQRIIESNNLTPEQIDYIELIGGCTRIPGLQQALKTYMKREVLDKHLNGDEAIANGAAFYAASMTHYFKVKDIRLKDISPYAVDVKVVQEQQQALVEELDETEEPVESVEETNVASPAAVQQSKSIIFKKNNRINVKRTLTFTTSSSFQLNVTSPDDNDNLVVYTVSNLPPSSESLNYTGKPKVHCSFRLTTNGIPVLERAEAEVTVSYQRLKAPKNDTKKPSIDDEDLIVQDDDELVEEKKVTLEYEWVTKVQRIQVNVTADYQTVKPLDKERFTASNNRINLLDAKDLELKTLRQEKNNLESYIYETRDKLESEEVTSCSTQAERDSLSEELDKSSNWLQDAEDNQISEVIQYQNQLKDLKKKAEKIFNRVNQKQQVPVQLEELEAFIKKIKPLVVNYTRDLNVTEEDVKFTNEKISTIEDWVAKKSNEYKVADFTKDLPFTTTDIKIKFFDLEKTIKDLSKKKKKLPPKKPSTTTKDTKQEKKEKKEDEEKPTTEKEPPVNDGGEDLPPPIQEEDQQQPPKQTNNDLEGEEEDLKSKDHIHDEL